MRNPSGKAWLGILALVIIVVTLLTHDGDRLTGWPYLVACLAAVILIIADNMRTTHEPR